MRVIAGTHRSRILHAPSGEETRPTHARVREAVFSILGNVANLTVLDVCAGTGALGIEALSRGAKHAVFVESAKEAFRCITKNVESLSLAAKSTLIESPLKATRARLLDLGPFDLIFCDPPWERVSDILRTLDAFPLSGLLSPSGIFVLEHSSKTTLKPTAIARLQLDDTRTWGDTAVSFFSLEGELTPEQVPDPAPQDPQSAP